MMPTTHSGAGVKTVVAEPAQSEMLQLEDTSWRLGQTVRCGDFYLTGFSWCLDGKEQ